MRKQKKNKNLNDLLVVIGLILLSIPIIVLFRVRPLISAIYLFFIPSMYLLLKRPRSIHRLLAGTLLFGIAFGFIFDFIAVYNRAWYVPDHQLVINYRILGVVPIDETIWFILWVFSIIVFYEHFIEHDLSDKISHNYRYGILPSLFALVFLLITYFVDPELLHFGYAYLVLGGGSAMSISI